MGPAEMGQPGVKVVAVGGSTFSKVEPKDPRTRGSQVVSIRKYHNDQRSSARAGFDLDSALFANAGSRVSANGTTDAGIYTIHEGKIRRVDFVK